MGPRSDLGLDPHGVRRKARFTVVAELGRVLLAAERCTWHKWGQVQLNKHLAAPAPFFPYVGEFSSDESFARSASNDFEGFLLRRMVRGG